MQRPLVIAAFAVSISTAVAAQSDQTFPCTNGGFTRRVEIAYAGAADLPCEVRYFKEGDATPHRAVARHHEVGVLRGAGPRLRREARRHRLGLLGFRQSAGAVRGRRAARGRRRHRCARCRHQALTSARVRANSTALRRVAARASPLERVDGVADRRIELVVGRDGSERGVSFVECLRVAALLGEHVREIVARGRVLRC